MARGAGALTISLASPSEDSGESGTGVEISFQRDVRARGSGVNRHETSSVDDRNTDAEPDLGVSAMVLSYRKLLAKAWDELNTVGDRTVRMQIKELMQKLEMSRAGVEPEYVRPSVAQLRAALGPAQS